MQALEAAAGAEPAERKAEGDGAEDAKSGATKEEPDKATAGGDSDSDVVCVDEEEGDTAHSGYSGFYRASRETGRSNVLLALQVILLPQIAASDCRDNPLTLEGWASLQWLC